jgi:putative molybdopterin biosynthesis protein
MALKRGEAHLAGAHLLDPESGEYNLPYIREHLPDRALRVITLVGRTQGLFVRSGNPKSIQSIRDLVREDVTFINRQRGSGTRLLLEYHLKEEKIDPQDVRGFNQEEFTHLTAAAAVASGRVDCALGIKAASEALDLDFIPLDHERYDLIIPLEIAESDLVKPVFRLLNDPGFRETVKARPGYDVSKMGELVAEIS